MVADSEVVECRRMMAPDPGSRWMTVREVVEVGANTAAAVRSHPAQALGIQYSALVAVRNSQAAAHWGMAAQILPVEEVLHHRQLVVRPKACAGVFVSMNGGVIQVTMSWFGRGRKEEMCDEGIKGRKHSLERHLGRLGNLVCRAMQIGVRDGRSRAENCVDSKSSHATYIATGRRCLSLSSRRILPWLLLSSEVGRGHTPRCSLGRREL